MTVASELRKIWKVLTKPEFRAFRRQIKAFRAAHGRGTPERFEGLNAGDVVLDVGGYHGDWADRMVTLYGVKVHVFEPHPRFAKMIEDRVSGNPDVVVHPYAIGRNAGRLVLSDDENASSALAAKDTGVAGQVRAVADVFEAHQIDQVAVVKMNIEGGEYDLLPALIEADLMRRIGRLTVQFHKYEPSQIQARDEIRKALEDTHECVWNFPFVWEEWALK